MSLFQLFVSSSRSKSFFSIAKKGASWVALFFQEKIAFFPSRLSTTIWGLFKLISFQWSVFSSQLYVNYVKPIAYCLLLTAYCLLPSSSKAQDTIKKPKIGLVLSGGGAKGFAHIGVLKVLEQAGIKIDFIGGTSMGAVIGGLYASGYNASQMDSIVNFTNFDNLLVDYVPRSTKSFYEKRNDELYAIVLPFNKLRIEVPQSLSKGIFNYNFFNRLSLHARHIRDFNQLPIPFLCIATDIENGTQVILDKGVLPQALFASSALPSVFSPVILDGKLLVDGGVTNNYPIEEIKKLGADIIIGVDVQSGLRDKEQLQDATKILFQITNLQTIEKMKENAKGTTIYIKPDIKNIGAISFEKAKEIILRGEEATFTVYEDLTKLASKTTIYQKPKLKIASDSLHIIDIKFGDLGHYSEAYIEGKLRFKAGSKIKYQDLEKGINTLDATNNFEKVTYSLEPNGNGDNLILNLIENPVITFLKFGLHYDGLYKSAVLANITNKNTFFTNDVISLDMIIGDNVRYNLDYYIDNGYNISVGFQSQLNQFNKNISNEISSLITSPNVNTINVNFLDLSNRLYFQSIFVQKFLIGVGLEHKFLNINSETIDTNDTNIDNSHYGSVYGYMKYDSFNHQYFPSKGWYFNSEIHNYLLSSDYSGLFNPFSIVKAEAGVAVQVVKKTTLKIQTEAGFAIGEDSVPYFDFVMGGYGFLPVNNFKPFYGYDFLSIAGDSFLKSSLSLDYEIFKKNHINFSANYANIGNNLYDGLDWISLPKYSGYAVGYGLETIIGPVEVKYSWSPETNSGFTWFSVGFCF